MNEYLLLGLSISILYLFLSTSQHMKINVMNQFDARHKPIMNVSHPTHQHHAATKGYTDGYHQRFSSKIDHLRHYVEAEIKKQTYDEEKTRLEKRVRVLETAASLLSPPAKEELLSREDLENAIAILNIPFCATVQHGVYVQGKSLTSIPFNFYTGGTQQAMLVGHRILLRTEEPLQLHLLLKLENKQVTHIRIESPDMRPSQQRLAIVTPPHSDYITAYSGVVKKNASTESLSFSLAFEEDQQRSLVVPYLTLSSLPANHHPFLNHALSNLHTLKTRIDQFQIALETTHATLSLKVDDANENALSSTTRAAACDESLQKISQEMLTLNEAEKARQQLHPLVSKNILDMETIHREMTRLTDVTENVRQQLHPLVSKNILDIETIHREMTRLTDVTEDVKRLYHLQSEEPLTTLALFNDSQTTLATKITHLQTQLDTILSKIPVEPTTTTTQPLGLLEDKIKHLEMTLSNHAISISTAIAEIDKNRYDIETNKTDLETASDTISRNIHNYLTSTLLNRITAIETRLGIGRYTN